MTASSAAELFDFRTGSNIPHSMMALLRQSIYRRLAGYDDVNDAERLTRAIEIGCSTWISWGV